MKKLVIIYGLICGLVVITPMLVLTNTATKSGSFEGAMLLGYATMVLAFSLVFVGIRNYRNKYNDGIIGFGKAFKVGILIVLIASTKTRWRRCSVGRACCCILRDAWW